MRTPDGIECPHYYEDFFRGRSTQECRLIARGGATRHDPKSGSWQPRLCRRCPVPGILRANACSHMVLEAQVTRHWLGLVRRITVYAVCAKHQVEVKDPYVGCGHCHPQAATILDAEVAKEE